MKIKNILISVLSLVVLGACDNKKTENELFMTNLQLSKITDYLYEVYYDDYDYDYATKFNNEKYRVTLGACSSVRNGSIIGRNYDWYYDENPEFIIHTSAKNGRHASIGVATIVPGLSTEIVESGEYNDGYKMLPFRTVDGINDAGVAININVVPVGDHGITTGTNPDGPDLFIVTAVRYVLDYADSVDSAIELLQNANIYAVNNKDIQEEVHYMISDSHKTVVVEFVDNIMVVVPNKNIMTNFYLSSGFTPHANGIERYNILRDNYDMGQTKTGMLSLMRRVWYTNAYKRETVPFWYSEFAKDYSPDYIDLTISSPISAYDYIINIATDLYNNRARNGQTWQTVHTSVYDLENKTLTIVPQETDTAYEFEI
ncbi:MAG: carcinine hydrolase/isopenicillin-N N-acyltransferase family protein [Alphaproteobacteria bacterium]|nr:carcinine hydrolase/isopenicillin-N N-acyltransferase family protein [Alphaproteobacteria bacterium]